MTVGSTSSKEMLLRVCVTKEPLQSPWNYRDLSSPREETERVADRQQGRESSPLDSSRPHESWSALGLGPKVVIYNKSGSLLLLPGWQAWSWGFTHPRAKLLSDATPSGPSQADRNTPEMCFKDSRAEASRDGTKRAEYDLGKAFRRQPARTILSQPAPLAKVCGEK